MKNSHYAPLLSDLQPVKTMSFTIEDFPLPSNVLSVYPKDINVSKDVATLDDPRPVSRYDPESLRHHNVVCADETWPIVNPDLEIRGYYLGGMDCTSRPDNMVLSREILSPPTGWDCRGPDGFEEDSASECMTITPCTSSDEATSFDMSGYQVDEGSYEDMQLIRPEATLDEMPGSRQRWWTLPRNFPRHTQSQQWRPFLSLTSFKLRRKLRKDRDGMSFRSRSLQSSSASSEISDFYKDHVDELEQCSTASSIRDKMISSPSFQSSTLDLCVDKYHTWPGRSAPRRPSLPTSWLQEREVSRPVPAPVMSYEEVREEGHCIEDAVSAIRGSPPVLPMAYGEDVHVKNAIAEIVEEEEILSSRFSSSSEDSDPEEGFFEIKRLKRRLVIRMRPSERRTAPEELMVS